MSQHHLLFKKIHENRVYRVNPNAKCNFYHCTLFFVLWPLSQIFKVIKYFRLIAVMSLVYIVVFTLHTIFNFWKGSKSANVGPYLLVDMDPRGSISTSRFGPRGLFTPFYFQNTVGFPENMQHPIALSPPPSKGFREFGKSNDNENALINNTVASLL
jgi:hypothetical protein